MTEALRTLFIIGGPPVWAIALYSLVQLARGK
jgi:uncharacterized protein YaaW (UPF0174 family)